MIYLFDVGSYHGIIPKAIIGVFKELDIEYKAFLFEPAEKHMFHMRSSFGDPNVILIQKALTDKIGKYPLYHTWGCGHSLHSTKHNIDPEDYEMVECEIFSEWYNENINRKNPNDIYILRVDIEGSEYEFYRDLISSEIYKLIDIYCGSLNDLYKLKNIERKHADSFKSYLQEFGIDVISINGGTIEEDVETIKIKILEKVSEIRNIL